METSSSRRTAKKLLATRSWKGYDFHGARRRGAGPFGKSVTSRLRRINDHAIVAAGVISDRNDFLLDMADAMKEEAFWDEYVSNADVDFAPTQCESFDFFLDSRDRDIFMDDDCDD